MFHWTPFLQPYPLLCFPLSWFYFTSHLPLSTFSSRCSAPSWIMIGGKHLIRLKGPQEQSETWYSVQPVTLNVQRSILNTAGQRDIPHSKGGVGGLSHLIFVLNRWPNCILATRCARKVSPVLLQQVIKTLVVVNFVWKWGRTHTTMSSWFMPSNQRR